MDDSGKPFTAWRKSVASDTGACIEIAVVNGSVLVRDSKNPYGAVLKLPPAAWVAFLADARSQAPGLHES